MVLIDFWAPWCAPCRAMLPIVDEIALTNEKIEVIKVNIDDFPDLQRKFSITSVPSFLIVDNDVVLKRITGAMPKRKFLDEIKEYL